MSQENEMPNSAAEGLLPAKRKRGRPRKEDNLFQGDNPMLSPGSDGVKRNRRRKIDPAYSPKADNALVGQIVSGVLDGSFDAGYFLTVKVRNSDTVLRGVVFEPGTSVPVSSETDVAPQVRMFHRHEIPLPVTDPPNLAPSFAPQTLQSKPKSQQPIKLLPKDETAQGSSEVKTNIQAENLQRKDTTIPAKVPSNTANNVPSVSPVALPAEANAEQKPEILSRNKNSRLQKGPPENINNLSLLASEAAHSKTERPAKLPQSKKSRTALPADVANETQVASQSSNAKPSAEKMVDILQENKITPVTGESSNEPKQELLVEPQALASVPNFEKPNEILQENNTSVSIKGSVNDINQHPE